MDWVYSFNPGARTGRERLVQSDDKRQCVCVCTAEPVQQSETSSLLLVILLCLFALLLLILLVIFLIRYNRGAKYKVFEKEKRHGAKGGRLDEEDRFCEYIRRFVNSAEARDKRPLMDTRADMTYDMTSDMTGRYFGRHVVSDVMTSCRRS